MLFRSIGIDGVPHTVYIDSDKNFWFYMPGTGIYHYQVETKSLKLLSYVNDNLPEGEIACMSECDNNLYAIYNNGMLVCIGKNEVSVKWEDTRIPEELGDDKFEYFAAYIDRDKDIWIYGPFGMWVYNTTKKIWLDSYTDILSSQRYEMIRTVKNDNYGRIWIGKDQTGIDIIDKKTKTVQHISYNPLNERGIQHNTVNAIFADDDGGMWIGTYKKGF